MFKKISLAAVVALSAALPMAAQAESNVGTGAGTITASARVNFQIQIPRFVYLRVGDGAVLAGGGTPAAINFTPALVDVGNGVAQAATAGSGDLGNGIVTVQVIGNAGPMTLAAVSSAPNLVNASSDTLPWTQILTAVTGSTPHPPINGASVSYPATANVVNASGTWTYTYANTTTPAAGTYLGQVTYTASSP
jgi:hypothetical protein